MVEFKLAIQDLWKDSLCSDDILSKHSGRTFQEVSTNGEKKSWSFQDSMLRYKVGTEFSFILLLMRIRGFAR